MMRPYTKGSSEKGKFWVMDRTPAYQSWEDVPESFPYVKKLSSEGSRSTADVNMTITWAICGFTCDTPFETFLPIPMSSPSERVGPNEYIRKAVVLGKTVATWKGYRIIDANGERTEFFAKMAARYNGTVLMLHR